MNEIRQAGPRWPRRWARPVRPVVAAAFAWTMACLGLGLPLPSSASATVQPPEAVISAWTERTRHSLTGRIWLPRERRLIDAVQLSRGILTGSPVTDALGFGSRTYVLLGEVHDNAEHHLLRAGLIDRLTEPTAFGRASFPAVVTEHITTAQTAALTQFRTLQSSRERSASDVGDLFRLLEWEKSGWPAARLFQPLYAAVIEARLPLLPGDVPRNRIRAVARGGTAALDAGEVARLMIDRPLEAPLVDALAQEIKSSHCGVLADSAIPGMALAQRYRDAHLADALIEARRTSGRAILLAGNGHIRADRGVPWYLRAREPDATIFTMLLIEVEDGVTEAARYVPHGPDGAPAADAVIFTPRVEREDPCTRMRQHMQRKE